MLLTDKPGFPTACRRRAGGPSFSPGPSGTACSLPGGTHLPEVSPDFPPTASRRVSDLLLSWNLAGADSLEVGQAVWIASRLPSRLRPPNSRGRRHECQFRSRTPCLTSRLLSFSTPHHNGRRDSLRIMASVAFVQRAGLIVAGHTCDHRDRFLLLHLVPLGHRPMAPLTGGPLGVNLM